MEIRGATGSNAKCVNGVYEPTEERHDGRAVYRRTDGKQWIEYHAAAGAGKDAQWYLTATFHCRVPGWD